jgi:DNA modification methylase
LIHTGDALAVLKRLDSETIQTCVTSPPYWGLRDYGTAKWKGGEPDCDHTRKVTPGTASIAKSTLGRNRDGSSSGQKTNGHQQEGFGSHCGKCGARRIDDQLGLEPTPALYVERLVAIFREVRRVLKADGTCWLNLGDSYAASGGGGESRMIEMYGASSSKCKGIHSAAGNGQKSGTKGCEYPALKPKNLVGIPWRVAFALQADGWILRSDIIWAKPNPMPESVTDRPTKAHEYIFLLAKSAKYFYDAKAVAEPSVDPPGKGRGGSLSRTGTDAFVSAKSHRGKPAVSSGTRNRRTVWTITPRPYKGAHFATFPTALVEPCVLAGSRPGDTVLDPFSGAGTTALVARQLGRKFTGIELNPKYVKLSAQRLDEKALAA